MSQQDDVVKEDELTPQPASEGDTTQNAEVKDAQEEATTNAANDEAGTLPGEKTDPALLLKSLQDERAKRKEIETRLADIETNLKSSTLSEANNEELSEKIDSLKSELSDVKEQSQKKDLIVQYPVLSEKWDEFETYRSENPGMSIETAAKAYLVDNGLYGRRKGLEKPTNGGRTTTPSNGLTPEEAADLRKNNPRKYRELLKKEQVKIVGS